MLPASWGTPGRFVAVIMLAILVGSGLTILAQATPSLTRDTESISLYSASTESDICIDDVGCGTMRLNVNSTRNGVGDVLCMEITAGSHHERGCANVTDSVRVGIDMGAWAELPTTSLNLHALTCDGQGICQARSTRIVVVRASWAAHGTDGQPDRSGEACTWPRSTDGAANPAVIDLTIDDYSIETFGNIRMVDASPLSECGRREG